MMNMKMRVGNRLQTAREDKKLKQTEMADLLGVSPATYSRLERNETSVDLDQVVNFAKTLDLPIQDFLPETMSINGNHQQSQVGFVIGNYYHYEGEKNTELTDIAHEIALIKQENGFLKKENALQAARIKDLEALLGRQG